jgi:hypothetical protein
MINVETEMVSKVVRPRWRLEEEGARWPVSHIYKRACDGWRPSHITGSNGDEAKGIPLFLVYRISCRYICHTSRLSDCK